MVVKTNNLKDLKAKDPAKQKEIAKAGARASALKRQEKAHFKKTYKELLQCALDEKHKLPDGHQITTKELHILSYMTELKNKSRAISQGDLKVSIQQDLKFLMDTIEPQHNQQNNINIINIDKEQKNDLITSINLVGE